MKPGEEAAKRPEKHPPSFQNMNISMANSKIASALPTTTVNTNQLPTLRRDFGILRM